MILAAIAWADNPGLNEAPTTINGGGKAVIGSSGIANADKIRFKTPLIVKISNIMRIL
jgi:hypothetical protein